MNKKLHLPLWVHVLCLAVTFFGWIGISYIFDRGEGLAQTVIEAFVFTMFLGIFDAVTMATTRIDRDLK